MADAHFDARRAEALAADRLVRAEFPDCFPEAFPDAGCNCQNARQRARLAAYAAARDCVAALPPERQLRLLQLAGAGRMRLTLVADDGRLRDVLLDRDALLARVAGEIGAASAP